MKLTLETRDLKEYGIRMAELGVQQYLKSIEPLSDLIKKKEVEQWLKNRGERVTIKQIEQWGKVKPKKTGNGLNSPLYYSKVEILAALNAIELRAVIEY
jgi:hypothetical protein